MMKSIMVGAALLAAPFFFVTDVQAEEVIHDFAVTAVVHKDGAADITEDITVTAENNQIRHGIYRDIPTEYTDRLGNLVHVPLSLTGAERDSQPEPHRMDSYSNGLRIYLGDKDHYVPAGEHRYTLHYTVHRVVGFFDTGDEFYWNVTGNGWIFPIEHASIRVVFPEGVNIINTAGYVGYQGSRAGDYVGKASGNIFEASTSRVLQPNEGFTVVAAVPVGIIAQETLLDKIHFFLIDNMAWLVWGLTTLLLLAYLTASWWRVGRDVDGVVVPRFDVPEGVTPDMLRYVTLQKYDVKTFACLLVNAAVRKLHTIDEQSDQTVFKRLGGITSSTGGYDIEGPVLDLFYNGSSNVTIPKKTFFRTRDDESVSLANDLQRAQAKHQLLLSNKKYFTTNMMVKVKAILLSFWGVIFGLYLAHTDAQKALVVFGSLFIHIPILWAYWVPLNKRTSDAQKIADYGQGLRMYLRTAEQARMNKLFPQTVTPETFEKLLPYALALDVEQEWCEYFAGLVAAGAVAVAASGYTPLWYHSYHSFNYSHFTDSLTSLSGAISTSSTPPGSNSGFGGGGGSGGGGGGGGGGGW